MHVQPAFDDGGQQVVGRIDVVVDRVQLVPRRLHRIGGGALFGEMDHAVGRQVADQGHQTVELLAYGHVDEADVAARHLFPGLDPLAHGADRRQRLDLQLIVDIPPAQIVDDGHVPALGREMQGRRPAAEAVAA